IRSRAMLASAMSSSRTGAWPHHSASRCPWISTVSPMRSRYCTAGSALTCIDECMSIIQGRAPGSSPTQPAPVGGQGRRSQGGWFHSHVIDGVGEPVEGGMPIHLVLQRVEVHVLVARVARDDVIRASHPDAGAHLA